MAYPFNAGEGGVPPLHGAVMFGQIEMAEWLLAHGADVDILNFERKTPLRAAADAAVSSTMAALPCVA